jgi:signal transduction histidine kinase
MPQALEKRQPKRRQQHRGLHSLRAKFTLGYTLVALLAIVIITLTSIISVAINVNSYERSQLSSQARDLATLIGQRYLADNNRLAPAAWDAGPGGPQTWRHATWLVDSAGKIIFAPGSDGFGSSDQDVQTIQAALQQALRGHETTGTLPDQETSFLWITLSHRPFIAEPIHEGGQASGAVVGALAQASIRPGPDTAVPTVNAIMQVLLWTLLSTVLMVTVLGALISNNVTRPVARLTRAAARLAAGDYHQRVRVQTRDELGRLSEVFNEMAAALEADVGELRRQERLRRELVANVSHDLATPLTAIQGFTEALMDGVITDERQREETLALIGKETARLRRLVADLNHLSRVESPALRLDLAPLHLWTLVDETLAVLQPECEAKGVRVENRVSMDLPLVSADSDKLTEVLLNLLDNALRYTPEGGSISIDAETKDDKVWVWVQDTGAGMEAGEVERIFDRFYRADSSRSASTGGSGLGLAIVKVIIEAHGGQVGATSAPGQGMTIWFSLPKAA